jgi:hypothetical protein
MEKTPKNATQFVCECCDFKCSKESDYNRHTMTRKHTLRTKLNNTEHTNHEQIPVRFSCKKCKKEYIARNSLWYHEKNCNYSENLITSTDKFDVLTNLVVEVVKSNSDLHKQNQEAQHQTQEAIKQNQELQKQMIEICKNGVNTTNNVQTINNNNSNNKSFNLNVFLNETCKDAMNMKEFVDSIQITLTDIENMGKLGFVNGISNIIVNRLKAIDVHLRPVHCTDQRRETMYVKEKNQWTKEEEDNKNIRRFIQLVAHKNTKNLSLFKNKHPDCLEYHSKYNDQYNKIVMETFGGYGNTDYDSENKIIRKLVKELAIDKSN